MALFRCGGGSSQPTETNLWTNADPTQQQAAVTLNLTGDIDNFDAIVFEYKANTAATDTSKAIYSPADVKKSSESVVSAMVMIGGSVQSSFAIVRAITYTSNTELHLTAGLQMHSTSGNNASAILVNVIGLKY